MPRFWKHQTSVASPPGRLICLWTGTPTHCSTSRGRGSKGQPPVAVGPCSVPWATGLPPLYPHNLPLRILPSRRTRRSRPPPVVIETWSIFHAQVQSSTRPFAKHPFTTTGSMGVQQPRAYTMPQHPQMPSSPSMVSAASPATRKRRFMDIILVGEDRELSTSEVDEEAELTQRVTFKRSKSGEAPMSVRVDRTEILCDTSSQPGTPMDKSPTSKDASSPSSSSTKSSRPNMSASQTITLDMLRPHFEKPLAQVAQVFGICVTLLKKICRKNGLARWPHRQIIGLRKSIASMEQAIGHFEGARRDSYAQQLEKQRSKLAKLLEDPTSCNLLAVEDEFLPTQHIMDQHTRATTAQQMTPQTSHYSSYAPSPVYETHAYAPAYSYPTGYSYHSAQPTLASPPRLSYAPQHYYPTPYSQPAAPTHQPSASLTLPPLRTDSRPLPPLSALVGRRW